MKFSLLLIALLASSVAQGREVNGNHDFQIWSYNAFSYDLRDRWRLSFEPELRFGGNASVLYHYHLQARLSYSPCDSLEIASGYRQIIDRNFARKTWVPVYSPLVDVFLKFPLGCWNVIDRNRTQYIMREGSPNTWIYRNRFMLISPWKFGRMELNPVVWDEVFFVERVGFAQNRLAVGAAVPFSPSTKVSLYYLWRDFKRAESWIHQRVIYAWYEFSF